MSLSNRNHLLSISIIFMFVPNLVFAQEVVFKGNININGKNTRFISGTENNGTILLNVNRSEGADNFYLINSSNEVIQVYDIASTPEKLYNVIHLTSQGDYFYVYTYYKGFYTPPNSTRLDLTYFHFLKFARDGSLRPEFKSLTGINPYDQYMMTLSNNDSLYIIGVNKDKFSLTINIISPTQEIFHKEFKFSDKKDFRKFYREDYFPVKNLPENSFETFLHKNKAYIRGSELIFISDDNDGPVTKVAGNELASLNRNTTFISRFNLLSGKVSVQELRHNYTIRTNHNSFLYEDNLFSLRFTKEEYSISIVDLLTMKEIGGYYQNDIENAIDWTNLIVSENKTLTGDKLKFDFNRRTHNSVPVIGIQYKDAPSILFGLKDRNPRIEDGKLVIGGANNVYLTSLGAVINSTDAEYILLKLPMYYVPAAIRAPEKRMYSEILYNIEKLTLLGSNRPLSIYDELEQLTEKWKDKHESKAVFSFENDTAVFLAYLTLNEGNDDVYVTLEKFLRK